MRAIVFTAVMTALLAAILARPVVGAYAWTWIGLMNPHRYTYGFASAIPWAQLVAMATLGAMLFTRDRRAVPWTPVTAVLIGLILWMSITSLFALNPDSARVMKSWTDIVKIQLMLLVTIVLVFERKRIDVFVWVVVGSIAFFGVKGGLWSLLTGGSGRVWGPPGTLIGGNNELGCALVMTLPLMYYLGTQVVKPRYRIAMWVAMGLCGVAVLGTHSRGALLAITAMAVFLALKSHRPVLGAIVVGVVLAGAIAVMPESWSDRMSTIRSYQEDSSAMSRIETWTMIWRLALDRPIVGGGFNPFTEATYLRYHPEGAYTAFSAHSIYFQALAEHGFVGLGLLLLLGITTWRQCGRTIRRAAGHEPLQWAASLARMIQVSVVGFAVGGTFLGLLHWDMPYYLAGMSLMLARELRAAERAGSLPDAGRPAFDRFGADDRMRGQRAPAARPGPTLATTRPDDRA